MQENKYKFNNKRKKTCPYCHTPKKFSPLLGFEDDLRYAMFGICDRANTCEANKGIFPPQDFNSDTFQPEAVKPKIELLPPLELSTIYLNDEKVRYYLSVQKSNLHTYALACGITPEHLLTWGIGTDKHENTVFLFRDYEGRWCNLKRGKYNEAGKREKGEEKGFFSLPQPYQQGENAKPERYSLPLFGEHKLSKDKNKIVFVVESEKTALFASFHYRNYDWVACGSANGLSDGKNGTNDKINPLKGREVVWLCDADKAGRKNSSLDNLAKYEFKYTVLDLFPKREDGWDLADEIAQNRFPDLERALNRAKKEADLRFWGLNKKGEFIILQEKFIKFLEAKGFSSWRKDNGEVVFVQKTDNILKEVISYDIKHFLLRYIKTLPNPECLDKKTITKKEDGQDIEIEISKNSDDLVDVLMTKNSHYLGKDKLDFLKFFEEPILRDAPNDTWFFFKNCAVQVLRLQESKPIIKVLEYSELPACIWESQILPYNYTPVGKSDYQKGDFFRFLSFISAGEKKPENLLAFMQAFGYLLHTFKNPAFPVAVIIGDAGTGEGSRGGRGKGIFFQAAGKVREMVTINGKGMKSESQDGHVYELVTDKTNLLWIDDTDERFDFTNFFPALTTGLGVNPKNQKRFYLPFSISPKFGFTTNFVFAQEDASHQRRKLELLVEPYFSPAHTPSMEFGRNLFDGWDEAEWNLFFNTAIACAAEYFMCFGESLVPVIKPDNPDLALKKMLALTKNYHGFMEWAEYEIKLGEKYDKKELMQNYIGNDDELKYLVKQSKFTSFLHAYADYNGWGKIETKSGASYYIVFTENKK